MQSLWREARFALRLLRKEPGFALVAVLTIALGVGATTTLFSVADGVLLKPLPWPAGNSLVRVSETREGRNGRVQGTVSNGAYVAWAEHPETIDDIGGWLTQSKTLTGAGDPERLVAPAVTAGLFPTLNAQPLLGRLFDRDAGKRGQPGAVLLSYGLWQSRFGGRADTVGDHVELDGQAYTVVGVMPRGFAFPDREARLWTAWAVPPVHGEGNYVTGTIFRAIARLRPGVTAAQAAAEATARARSAPDMEMLALALFGSKAPAEVRVGSLADALTADVRPAILVMLVAGVLLLVTAIANIGSLQLARATARRREFAIRAAIGAGGARLTRQLIVESGVLAAAGGAAGFALAAALHRVLPRLLPTDFPRTADIAIDGRVLAFTIGATTVAAIASGVLPALQARRVSLVETLAEGGTAPVGGGWRSPVARARSGIMIGQIAIACVLMIGAALLARSFIALLRADRGYDPTNVLTARLPMPSGFGLEPRIQTMEALTGRMQAVPGVRAAAFSNALPLVASGGFHAMRMPSPRDPAIQMDVNTIERVVSPGFFSALGLRIAQGRAFADTDTSTAPMVVVVNRSFAARYLKPNPVGQTVPSLGMCRGDHDRWEVVGVVDDMRQAGVSDPDQPEVFIPYRQIGCAAAMPEPILVVRTASDPLPYVDTLRRLVREQSPSLVAFDIITMEDRVTANLAKPRLYAVVMTGFGAFALIIAGVGLFGVLSYSVAQRAREIGIRAALGAQSHDIVVLVLKQGILIVGVGLAAGLWIAAAGARVLSVFLYGVTTHDAWSYAIVPLVLALVAAVACFVPARRAVRVDPLAALRSL